MILFRFLNKKIVFLSWHSLANYIPSLSTFREVDASEFAIGSVMNQIKTDSTAKVIATYSRKLSECGQN
jgi:hypothetical protein